MGLIDDYSWICIKTLKNEKKAHELEQIFYRNKLPVQVRSSDGEHAVWVPMKYKELSEDVVENYLIDNLAQGFVKFEEDVKPEDKVYIGRAYERRAPPKFYFLLIVLGLFLLLLRLSYGIDFL